MIINYNKDDYGFRAWANEALGVTELHLLHERSDLGQYNNFVEILDACRAQMAAGFPKLRSRYIDFIETVIAPLFGGVTDCQVPPTFRVHINRGRTASAFHRDRDYGVAPHKLNVWVPFTHVWGGNSIWIETEEGSNDLKEVKLNYGQALIFDGANLLHGSIENNTGSTRVSMDLRFTPQCRTEEDH